MELKTKNKRNGNIELLRFLFSMGIVFHHISAFYPQVPYIGGYLGVDFFFMISGAFLARNNKVYEDIHESWKESLDASKKYLFRRILSVFPYFVLSTVIGYLVCLIATDSVISPLYLINDFAFLIEFGFSAPSATGTTWFLSAMFIALFILYPIVRRYYNSYVKYIGLFVSLFIYGALIHIDGYIGHSNQFLFGFFNAGILRAIAGMTMGGVAFELAARLKRLTTQWLKIIVSLVGIFLYLFEFYFMHIDNHQLDQIEIFIIFFAIIITFSGISIFDKYFDNNISVFLGKFSMVLFMNHFYWACNMDSFIEKYSISFLPEWYHRVIAIIILSFVTSLLVLVITQLFRKIIRRFRQKKIITIK